MSSKIFDDFQEMFHDESEFIDSIRDMENNSEWLPEIPRKELQVIPLDGPMFVADAVQSMALTMIRHMIPPSTICMVVTVRTSWFSIRAQPGACVIPVVRHSTPPPV